MSTNLFPLRPTHGRPAAAASVSSMDVVLERTSDSAEHAAYAAAWPETLTTMLLLVTRDQYDSLGCPATLTLTLRPGDRLTYEVES